MLQWSMARTAAITTVSASVRGLFVKMVNRRSVGRSCCVAPAAITWSLAVSVQVPYEVVVVVEDEPLNRRPKSPPLPGRAIPPRYCLAAMTFATSFERSMSD